MGVSRKRLSSLLDKYQIKKNQNTLLNSGEIPFPPAVEKDLKSRSAPIEIKQKPKKKVIYNKQVFSPVVLHAFWCIKQQNLAPAGSLIKEILPLENFHIPRKWMVFIILKEARCSKDNSPIGSFLNSLSSPLPSSYPFPFPLPFPFPSSLFPLPSSYPLPFPLPSSLFLSFLSLFLSPSPSPPLSCPSFSPFVQLEEFVFLGTSLLPSPPWPSLFSSPQTFPFSLLVLCFSKFFSRWRNFECDYRFPFHPAQDQVPAGTFQAPLKIFCTTWSPFPFSPVSFPLSFFSFLFLIFKKESLWFIYIVNIFWPLWPISYQKHRGCTRQFQRITESYTPLRPFFLSSLFGTKHSICSFLFSLPPSPFPLSPFLILQISNQQGERHKNRHDQHRSLFYTNSRERYKRRRMCWKGGH